MNENKNRMILSGFTSFRFLRSLLRNNQASLGLNSNLFMADVNQPMPGPSKITNNHLKVMSDF